MGTVPFNVSCCDENHPFTPDVALAVSWPETNAAYRAADETR